VKGLALALAILALPIAASAQRFRRPVACDACIANWYYFDETAGGGTSDWNCGTSSYDGHRGSDFSLSGGNGAIAAGNDVVAVADGVVRSTIDGFFDHCTSCPASGADPSCGLGFGGGFGNHVLVDHGGYTVVYAHMRTGSVRVAPGDRVTCGQVVGQIGSSGCTTGAHLHVEPRPLAGGYLTAFDPFAGGCSPLGASLWVDQDSYRGMPAPTCDGPLPPTCPAGWYDVWTCEGGTRRRCIGGETMVEECSPGSCESRAIGTDDVCDADGDSFATDEGDCDDHDARAHPGGSETCGDAIDQDCSGGDEACPGVDAAASADASATDGGPRDDAGGRDAAATSDAGAARHDGGSVDASGDAEPGGRAALTSGCGCGVASTRAPFPLALLLVSVLVRTRRRGTFRSFRES
jgi:MYXO-CTERM domain-containing protein